MTSRERVVKTLKHEPVDRVPRELWALPGVPIYFEDEYSKLVNSYPSDFGCPNYRYGQGERAKGTPFEVGQYTDAWGCVWHVGQRGIVGEVKEPPLADWSALASYRPPFELLNNAEIDKVNQCCAESDKFMKVGTETRPFERLQFLRGSENLFIDLAYGSAELFDLLSMLHDFFCREMQIWVDTDIDGVSFMDDWGSQTSLLISPEMWRQVFKPLYKEYCDILHSRNKFVFFHSDGFIESIYPDLIEIGVDAINSQLFCMDIERLAENYGGKITFWGEIDRQHILPFGTEGDVRAAVRRVRAALDKGQGGVIAECEWGMDTPAANVATVFDEWMK